MIADEIFEDLTDRELTALRLLADGHLDQEIADIMHFSTNHLRKGIIQKAMLKLHAVNRGHAIAIAMRRGIV